MIPTPGYRVSGRWFPDCFLLLSCNKDKARNDLANRLMCSNKKTCISWLRNTGYYRCNALINLLWSAGVPAYGRGTLR